MTRGFKFVAGTAESGRIVLERGDGSTTAGLPGLAIVQSDSLTLTDNGDSTYDLTFDGS